MPPPPPTTTAELVSAVRVVLERYWGYDTLRPLQGEAIAAGLKQRDSLVVMPTGGGKSLCYQVPPVVANRLDVVVSPLISLMKDQVDGLRACGYPASALHSQLEPAERQATIQRLREGTDRLVFVSPERLMRNDFLATLQDARVRAFSIDEAHCISHWGHDFRPEYRQLATLKQRFPGVSVHAFTATATPRVREDIVEQLRLQEPEVLVGRFDRPNLSYRIVPRVDVQSQVLEIVQRHAREAVIVYCITRRETESIAAALAAAGVSAAAYHAGMAREERRKTQEAFSEERLDVVVATVAFGMGIDRSNVRCVVHAAMPKSVEHYQQETGRAGRDGLEAECVLLYSAADVLRWKGLMERAGEDGDAEAVAAQLELLGHMQGICGTLECRHRALSRYFGQAYEAESCDACDVCLDEVDAMPESTVIAQKILSCVARLDQRFGVGHVVQVCRGAATEAVRRFGHEGLSTYGLLSHLPEKTLTNLIYQLVDQRLLVRSPGDRPVLQLAPDAMDVLRGSRDVQLVEPKSAAVRRSHADESSWEGVDRGLFEALRALRRTIATERSVPPYVVFGDASLRAMARERPSTLAGMRLVRGVGAKKLADLGETFVDAIVTYCDSADLETDVVSPPVPATAPAAIGPVRVARPAETRAQAFELFGASASLADVADATGRTPATVCNYLVDFIEETRPSSVEVWVDPAAYERVVTAAVDAEPRGRLKPIHTALDGDVDYDTIRIVLAHQRTHDAAASEEGLS
ncbi:MAG: DNA helicase RecQ [Phycisphaerales bacterium]|nr:DNA helicase RecQ [Phycisphaerales bacterium]